MCPLKLTPGHGRCGPAHGSQTAIAVWGGLAGRVTLSTFKRRLKCTVNLLKEKRRLFSSLRSPGADRAGLVWRVTANRVPGNFSSTISPWAPILQGTSWSRWPPHLRHPMSIRGGGEGRGQNSSPVPLPLLYGDSPKGLLSTFKSHLLDLSPTALPHRGPHRMREPWPRHPLAACPASPDAVRVCRGGGC